MIKLMSIFDNSSKEQAEKERGKFKMVEVIEVNNMQLVDLDTSQWNSLAEKTNTKSFIQAMNRHPVSYAEVIL